MKYLIEHPLLLIMLISILVMVALFAFAPVYEETADGSWRLVEKNRRGKITYKNTK